MDIKTDLFADNKELFLIIQLLRFQWHKEAGLKSLIAELARDPGFDWKEFLRLVRFHKVYTYVYSTIKELKCFPETTAARLKKLNIDNSEKALVITAELKAVNRLLGGGGISFTVLKGQPLSMSLYGNTARRSSRDIDLLVDSDDLEKIMELFAGNYICMSDSNIPLKYIESYSDHLVYKNKTTDVFVEVHWKLMNYNYLMPGFTEAARRRIMRIGVAGTELNALSFHDHLFYCLMHGIKHCWLRLFWLVDVAEFCRKDEFVLTELFELGEKYGVSVALGSGLLLCNQLFAVPRLEESCKTRLLKNRTVNRLYAMFLTQIAAGKIRIKPDSPYIKQMKRKAGLVYKDCLLKRDFCYLTEVMKDRKSTR
ncbi:MAG: nucleotidyltransferase family protein, partial [Victivallaceae bacterium]|nr:nucleotidyltransferase family protein [Victivallaceae bacterium]